MLRGLHRTQQYLLVPNLPKMKNYTVHTKIGYNYLALPQSHIFCYKGEQTYFGASFNQSNTTRICSNSTHCGLITPYGGMDLRSAFAQVMVCCLTVSSYLNQCWLIISVVWRHLHEGNFTGNAIKISILDMTAKINDYILHSHPPGFNGLGKYQFAE